MLTWVGKRLLSTVKAYPVQLRGASGATKVDGEIFNVALSDTPARLG